MNIIIFADGVTKKYAGSHKTVTK